MSNDPKNLARRGLLRRIGLGGLALATGGIAVASLAPVADAQGYPPMPPPPFERRPPPPPPGMIWEPGHYRWDGYRYVWVGGHFRRGGPGYRQFVPGHWAWRGGRQVWIPQHWR
ncbi:hypothetical protein [Acidisoma silvae]|uniref:YXWGXW repeat-containing protein n=1 Tax=Acidisoma silvae TaxID=2802396 RepID=A0A963YU91_9PROT|nr:hypothetical protein [Acidisoma silvae]MCB8877180.1 YXWGXW repeat-containing protein [Acidisoma silvae]